MHSQLQEWMSWVRPIAWEATTTLLKYYQSQDDLEIHDKGGEEGVVTAADLASNKIILQGLYHYFERDRFAFLSEETDDDLVRLERDWVWIIDPLDGTSDFVQRTGEFAIHIGLAYQQRPVLALVAIPVAEKLYTAIQGLGAFVEDRWGRAEGIRVSSRSSIESMGAISSRSHRSPRLDFILDHLPKSHSLGVGSIGGKFVAIAEGRADYYVSVSGQSAPKDWDYCAPELILQEAGGKLTRFDQTTLTYNNKDVVQWGDILASNGHCHDRLCELSALAAQQFDLAHA